VTIVRLHRFPRPVLPIAGGLLFAILIGVWYTSAVWLYRQESSAAPVAKTSVVPASANAAAGKTVFESDCSSCHTLKAAGAGGQIGPNLDQLRPGFAQVQAKVESGGGGMPSFSGTLSPQQIRDVAAFVATRAGD
jgi:mono/diheme cytochrome c family protein